MHCRWLLVKEALCEPVERAAGLRPRKVLWPWEVGQWSSWAAGAGRSGCGHGTPLPGEECRPVFHQRVVDFGLQGPGSRFSSASDLPCDLGQAPQAAFGLGFSIHSRGGRLGDSCGGAKMKPPTPGKREAAPSALHASPCSDG